MPLMDKGNPEEYKEIDAFLRTHPNGWFTQSLCWPEVKREEYEALAVRDANGAISAAAVVMVKCVPLLKRTLLYVPRGPVLHWEDQETVAAMMRELEALGREKRAYKIVLDPQVRVTDAQTIRLIESFGFTLEKPSTDQSGIFYVLSLEGRSAEELLASFHPKWRYNIRLAMRKGVECRCCGPEALEEFYPIWCETARRDGFPVRSKAYLRRYMEAFEEDCRLYLCDYQGQALSGAIAVRYAGRVCYVFGGSSARHREAMPNYLMQYEMIRWAAESGCGLYDFGGLPAFRGDGSDGHSGVYGFKRGFRGTVVAYTVGFVKLRSRFIDRLARYGNRLAATIRRLAARR